MTTRLSGVGVVHKVHEVHNLSMSNATNTHATATYLPRYEIVSAIGGAHKGEMVTLYEAVKMLNALAAEGKTSDATHIAAETYRSGGRKRIVAFYCNWKEAVCATNFVAERASQGAREDERFLVNSWS
jgi:hypothetical protein